MAEVVIATKAVRLRFVAPPELRKLLEVFRSMCNDAIRIAVSERPKNKFQLQAVAYPTLKEYGLHSHYAISACKVAYSLYKNKRRKVAPHIKRTFLKLDNESYALNHLLLRIPTTPRNFIFILLEASNYHLSLIDDQSLKRGSVTISEKYACIALSKRSLMLEPQGYLGLDANEKNATVSGTDGYYNQFKELGEVVEMKEKYREIRSRISNMTGKDRRIARGLLEKYGRRETNRTLSRIHKVTSQTVDYAKEHKLGIKMEELTGIRKLYRKGNGQSTSYRARMNSWVFGETQRQIDYKAKWEGVPDWFVNPRGTSSYCLCGSHVVRLADRKVYCPTCDRTWDRDDLASKNIMACAVPQGRPSKRSGEEERGDDGSNPQSGWGEVGSAHIDQQNPLYDQGQQVWT